MHLALQYATAAASMTLAQVPEQARSVIKAGLADALGTTVAGRHEDAVRVLLEAAQPFAPGQSRVLLSTLKASAGDAAMVNGTAAHALDFDDIAMHAHLSTVLLPALLALGEEVDASGADLLLAYAAGYEVWGDLAYREDGLHHEKGWHPTSVIGTVAAAAGSAKLLQLPPGAFAHALGIAASMSSGLTVNFGTMTKPFHAGRAAQSGILAARLAAKGFTSRADAIEHERGLLAAISPTGAPDLSSASQVGTRWHLLEDGLNIKRFPTCYCNHRSLDAMLQVCADGKVTPADIESIEVTMSQEHYRVLLNHRPTTALEAKFSLEFAMAAACVAGQVGLVQLQDDFVRRDDIQALLPRVKAVFATERAPGNASAALFDQVRIQLRSGGSLTSEPVYQAKGHAKRPLSRTEREAKFVDCLAFGGVRDGASTLFAAIEAMETLPRVRDLAIES